MSLLHKDDEKKDTKASKSAKKDDTAAVDANPNEEWLDQPEDPSLDEERPETQGKTSLVQVEGDSTPKRHTVILDDMAKDDKIRGVEFTIQFPIADSTHSGQSYDQIVSNLKSEIYQFAEKSNIGAVNFRNKELDTFVNDEVEERSNLEHAKAAGPDEDTTG